MQNKQTLFSKAFRKASALFSINERFLNLIRNRKKKIIYNQTPYIFSTPNSLCLTRANTFATKEPETLKWIELLLRVDQFHYSVEQFLIIAFP